MVQLMEAIYLNANLAMVSCFVLTKWKWFQIPLLSRYFPMSIIYTQVPSLNFGAIDNVSESPLLTPKEPPIK